MSKIFLDVFGQSTFIVLLSSLSAYAGSPVLNIPRAVLISANKVEVKRTVLSPIIGMFILISRCKNDSVVFWCLWMLWSPNDVKQKIQKTIKNTRTGAHLFITFSEMT